MNINYDKVADAIYMTLRKGKVARTVEMKEQLIVDLDKKGNILGIELLDAGNQLQKNMRNGIPVKISSGLSIAA
ncbi:TPA: DUF2283 domain-containing protein [Candidatus Kaiserbacteria bacterium]|nr:MAG: hypothetical protein UY93_C0002G0280 [Parcubacteria group bacterium GW2011_GWA1_56_13]KKW46470.1 MAG: hypothetical protein UY97_C0005G0015 [Parcubacteria group bacterium GW2011_GWB1_57_6]HCR52314.1 DUF2283 domain-containing protein [Candidatus Kaiserbacteria bacterium]